MLGQDLSHPHQHFIIHLLLELRHNLPQGVSVFLHHLPIRLIISPRIDIIDPMISGDPIIPIPETIRRFPFNAFEPSLLYLTFFATMSALGPSPKVYSNETW